MADRNFNVYWEHGASLTLGDTIVDAGKTYKLRVRADYTTGDGAPWQGPWSVTAIQRVLNNPPAAPAELTVTSASHDGVGLSWSAPGHDDLTGYKILRGAGGGALAVLIELDQSALTHTDTTTEDDTAYRYAVVALSLDGDSPQSSEISATTPPRTPAVPDIEGMPAKPTGLTASLDGEGGVELAWTDPADAEVTGYRVLRGVDADSLVVVVEDTGTSGATHTDASPVLGSSMAYAVQAKNAVGLSQISTAVPVTAIDAPFGVGDNSHAFAVELTWRGPNHHSTVAGYKVFRGDALDSAVLMADVSGVGNRSYTDDTVLSGETYFYAIRAYNSYGMGPASAIHRVEAPALINTITLVEGPNSAAQHESGALVSNSDSAFGAEQQEVSKTIRGRRNTPVVEFTTGNHPGGYSISGVQVYIDSSSSFNAWLKPFAAIHASGEFTHGGNVSANPELHRFTAADQPSGATAVTLTSSTSFTARPDTTYALLFGTDHTGNAVDLRSRAAGSRRDRCGELDWVLEERSLNLIIGPGGTTSFDSAHVYDNPLAVSILGSQITTHGTSEPECPDSPASTSTHLAASETKGRGSAIAALQNSDDRDWFKVTLAADTNYEFRAYGSLHGHGGGTAGFVEIKRVLNSSGVAQTAYLVGDEPPIQLVSQNIDPDAPESTDMPDALSDYITQVWPTQRAYFNPTVAGTYYVEVGMMNGYGAGETPDGRSISPTYTFRVREADDYAASTMTTGVVSSDGFARGFFYTEHNGDVDVDWVRVALKSGVKYQFTLDVRSNANTTEIITGIYNSSGTQVRGGQVVDGNYAWLHVPFTPTADGDYYVGPSSVQHSDGGKHPAPDWTLRVWSENEDFAYSEPSNSDLPSMGDRTIEYVTTSNRDSRAMNAGSVAGNGAASSGRTPAVSDKDIFAVMLEKDVRYRFNVVQTAGINSGNCLTVNLYEFPRWLNLATSEKRASGTPSPRGTTTIFYTPEEGGMHYLEVGREHLYRNRNDNSQQNDRCDERLRYNSNYDKLDLTGVYDVIVHPASEVRNATSCYGGSIAAAWAVVGKPVMFTQTGRSNAATDSCVVDVELVKGKAYTVTLDGVSIPQIGIKNPDGSANYRLSVIPADPVANIDITTTQSGIHRVSVFNPAQFTNTTRTITLTITERTS